MKTNSYLTTAVEAASAAGSIIRNKFGTTVKSQRKKGFDIVTEVDFAAEAKIREVLAKAYPSHEVLGEEEGGPQTTTDYLWIVDPLDGTRNFFHAIPFIGVSIALEVRGQLEVGVVYNPILDQLFTAVRGQGSFCNDKPLTASGVKQFDEAMIGTGFSSVPNWQFSLAEEIQATTQGIRRMGSAALDLCMVASGSLDGFWEYGLNPWDVAAGILILQEAGGMTTNTDGSLVDIRTPGYLASNTHIHKALLDRLNYHARS